MCNNDFSKALRQSEGSIIQGNIITYDDIVPILQKRYGLILSVAECAVVEDLEQQFVSAVKECCSVPTKLIGAEYFSTKTLRLNEAGTPLVVLDDLYFDHLHDAQQISTTRLFSALPPAPMQVGHRISGQSLTGFHSSGPIAVLDDGIFSGSTLAQLVNRLADSGITTPSVFVVVARECSLRKLRDSWQGERKLHVLGLRFTGGWDHSRDLLGIHGLRVGPRGYVPYWNIPDWISLQGVKEKTLLEVCKKFFKKFEEFLGDVFSLTFKREGHNLIPERNCKD